MDITRYKFNDADITDAEIGGNEEYVRLVFGNNSIDELIITKEDAIAMAQHFNVTEIDLIS